MPDVRSDIKWPHRDDELLVEIRRLSRLLDKYRRDTEAGAPFERHNAKKAARLRRKLLRFAEVVSP